ncbi:ribbon-helix-helix domain-containing protein [Candidatus Poriferisodalis sp.]|uniref:ribbon-helix-helix domain-containing protein n=1 Tax=Candidatus Poriferisodalis sp. TaxID=3101277 RepID=UPI003B01B6F4
MTQLVARIDDGLLAQLDELVASGDARSRSDAVRRALEEMLDRRRRRQVGEAIVDAYRRIPETDDEMEWAAHSTRTMIAEEPW